MTDSKRDSLYASQRAPVPFRFNAQVAEVFNDMINRSVPGYAALLQAIAELARRRVRHASHCYDLGCSLGAVSLAISRAVQAEDVTIFAVDNSEAMLSRARKKIEGYKHPAKVVLLLDDIEAVAIENADMVVLNFTLQFVSPEKRSALIEKIYQGLNPGGVLVLSEKIRFEDPEFDQLMTELHHQFKKHNGYSELEISQKRNALEKVLLPDTIDTHIQRLTKAGFPMINTWFQQYNFVSLLAIK